MGKISQDLKMYCFWIHQNGGLNIIDIESKVMSLESSWIPNLLGKGIQSSMVDMLLTKGQFLCNKEVTRFL